MTKRKVSGGGGDMPSAHAGNKRLRAALQLVQGSAVMQVAPHAARSARIPPKRATSARSTLARVRVTRPTRPRRVRSPQRGGERGRARWWVGGRLPELCTVRAPRVFEASRGCGVGGARRAAKTPPHLLGPRQGRAGAGALTLAFETSWRATGAQQAIALLPRRRGGGVRACSWRGQTCRVRSPRAPRARASLRRPHHLLSRRRERVKVHNQPAPKAFEEASPSIREAQSHGLSPAGHSQACGGLAGSSAP